MLHVPPELVVPTMFPSPELLAPTAYQVVVDRQAMALVFGIAGKAVFTCHFDLATPAESVAGPVCFTTLPAIVAPAGTVRAVRTVAATPAIVTADGMNRPVPLLTLTPAPPLPALHHQFSPTVASLLGSLAQVDFRRHRHPVRPPRAAGPSQPRIRSSDGESPDGGAPRVCHLLAEDFDDERQSGARKLSSTGIP